MGEIMPSKRLRFRSKTPDPRATLAWDLSFLSAEYIRFFRITACIDPRIVTVPRTRTGQMMMMARRSRRARLPDQGGIDGLI